jgi:serine/threonine protein phosphatase 1
VRGDKNPNWLRESDREYFESLPVAVSFDDVLVVHGGINPQRSLAGHTVEEPMTMRSPHGDRYDGPFWYDDYEGPIAFFRPHCP